MELPPGLSKALNSGESVVSGWISEIEMFWVGQGNRLFLVHMTMASYDEATVCAPVVAVGFVNNMIVVSHEDSLALFTKELVPLKNTFHLPTNVIVTVFEKDIAGCNDGSLRRVTVNPRREYVSVSGTPTLFPDDVITTIVELNDNFVTLSLNNVLSVFTKGLTRIANVQLKGIIGLWTTDGTTAYVLDKTTQLSRVVIGSLNVDVEPVGQLMKRRVFHSATWKLGFLTAVDRTRLSYDQMTLTRLVPYGLTASTFNMGVIFAVGSTPYLMAALSSSGVYHFFEKLDKNEDEEIWRFANCVERFWDRSIESLVNESTLIENMNDFFKSDFQTISDLCKYVLTIIDDYGSISSDYQKLFSAKPLSDFFNRERIEQFSRLRKFAFEFRLNEGIVESDPQRMTKLERMIAAADGGSEKQIANVLAKITSSFEELPTSLCVCCAFLEKHGFYTELIQCICKWANSVQPDSIALAYENGGCPTSDIDEAASYHLRRRIYDQLQPFLSLAVRTPESQAGAALDTALKHKNTVFQRYVLQYLEDNSTADVIKRFYYPEMIEQMKMINSRYLVDILIYKQMTSEAINQFIDNAKTVDVPYSVRERIEFLTRAAELCQNRNAQRREEVEKMRKAGEILEEFINNTLECPRYIFTRDPCDLINYLVDWGEYILALRIMDIYGEKRDDVLTEFLTSATPDEVFTYLQESAVYSEDEIAHKLFELQGTEAIYTLRDCRFSCTCIFKLIVSEMKMDDYIKYAGVLVEMLYSCRTVDATVRENVANLYCRMVLTLSVQDDAILRGYADKIRAGLGGVFIEASFTDIWDNL